MLSPTPIPYSWQSVALTVEFLDGKPKVTSTSEIAKALGKSPSQISRLRTGILNKFNEYM